ncbi:MAG TPA: DNA-binding protein [Chromatiales bacterium]|nr:DNA-binding protein [Chromatiales bacterium]
MAVKKKTAARKKTAKKATTKPVKRIKAIKEPYTRSAMLAHIAEATGLTKKQVTAVFDEYRNVIEGHVKKGSARVFTMPGLFKIKVTRKPATRARKGINPFTGEPMVFKAKPARNVVKIQPLKALKDMV